MSREHLARLVLPDLAPEEHATALAALEAWLKDNGTLHHEVREGVLHVEVENLVLSGGWDFEAAIQSIALALGGPQRLEAEGWEFSDGWFAVHWRADDPGSAIPVAEASERCEAVAAGDIVVSLRVDAITSPEALAAVEACLASLPQATWVRPPAIDRYELEPEPPAPESEPEPELPAPKPQDPSQPIPAPRGRRMRLPRRTTWTGGARTDGRLVPADGASYGDLALGWCAAVRAAAGTDAEFSVSAWDLARPRFRVALDASNWPIREPALPIYNSVSSSWKVRAAGDPTAWCGFCGKVAGDRANGSNALTVLVPISSHGAVCLECADMLVARLVPGTGLVETGGNPPLRPMRRPIACSYCAKGPDVAMLVMSDGAELVLCSDCLRTVTRIAGTTPAT